jgi:uncharacterized phage protein gp47/JayE
MANSVNYIPQVDYTSRDYSAIRDDLLNLINQYNPAWTSRDPSDLGMTLVELFAYMGDLMNFYTDRAANEGFLATASQRDSILQMAAMLGYAPTKAVAATTTLTLTNSTASAVTFPAKTQVATTAVVNGLNTQVVFETDVAVTVAAKVSGVNGTASVAATEGVTTTLEDLGPSTGSPSQVFRLANTGVINDSITVTVNNVVYTYLTSMVESNSFDTVFTTINDADENTYIIFGDGVMGRVPAAGNTVYATYRTGNGHAGNVPAQTLKSFLTNSAAGVTVTNGSAATGGADEESSDSIRLNTPRALKSLNRAVSLRDYAYLALQVSGVAKASADANSFNSIILYMAPSGDPGVSAGVATPAFTALADKVAAYFMDKTAPNVSLTILPPTYVPVNLEITVRVLPQYQQSVVVGQVNTALSQLVSTDSSFFADLIPVQYLLTSASTVNGVDYITVEHLRKNTSEQSFTVSSYTRTSNVAQLTTSATHNITVGQTIKVTNSANGGNNVDTAAAVVTAVGATTISFANTGGNLGATTPTVTSTVRANVVETISCAVNEIPSKGTFTLTGVGGIQ